MIKTAVVLLSGGLDSATAAAIVSNQGYEIFALTVDYGQRHRREIECAEKLAEWLKAKRHEVIRLPISHLLDSQLMTEDSGPPADESKIGSDIPLTYVPARNTILLSLALGWAESIGADAIVIGANSIDYSGYPDCRPAFIEAYRELIKVATRAGVKGRTIELLAPMIEMTKSDIVREGKALGVPFENTWSCYRGGEHPCGECEACILRKRGFESAGIADPAED